MFPACIPDWLSEILSEEIADNASSFPLDLHQVLLDGLVMYLTVLKEDPDCVAYNVDERPLPGSHPLHGKPGLVVNATGLNEGLLITLCSYFTEQGAIGLSEDRGRRIVSLAKQHRLIAISVEEIDEYQRVERLTSLKVPGRVLRRRLVRSGGIRVRERLRFAHKMSRDGEATQRVFHESDSCLADYLYSSFYQSNLTGYRAGMAYYQKRTEELIQDAREQLASATTAAESQPSLEELRAQLLGLQEADLGKLEPVSDDENEDLDELESIDD